MPPVRELNDPRLVKALAHPLRVSIMAALNERTASPSELAEELGVPLPNLSYHIRMLVQLDLLKLVRTRPRRGAIEHYYTAKAQSKLTEKAWDQVPSMVKAAHAHGQIRAIAARIGESDLDSPHTTIGETAGKVNEPTARAVSALLAEASARALKLIQAGHDPDGVDIAAFTLVVEKAPA